MAVASSTAHDTLAKKGADDSTAPGAPQALTDGFHLIIDATDIRQIAIW